MTSTNSSSLKSFLSGGVGGMCLVATIKVRLMADTKGEYAGMMDCLRKTVSRGGLRSLVAGMGPPLLSISPVYAVYFWGYDLGQRLYCMMRGAGTTPLPLSGIVFAGAFSALPGTLVLLPFDLIKVKLQVELANSSHQAPQQPRFRTSVQCLRHILQEEGFRGVWRGGSAMLAREIPSTMAYYTTYELVKRTLAVRGVGGGDAPSSPLAIITAGGLAGMANWVVAVPPDVIKTRYQTAEYPGGVRQVLRELLANEGPAALFKGLAPALVRAFPCNAACFLGVEVSKKALDRYL